MTVAIAKGGKGHLSYQTQTEWLLLSCKREDLGLTSCAKGGTANEFYLHVCLKQHVGDICNYGCRAVAPCSIMASELCGLQ